jgi:hypothetical protein
VERRAPAGEAGDGEVESAPEQVDGAGLAEEGGTKPVEDPVHRYQGLMEVPHGLAVVRPVAAILGEGHRVSFRS